MVKECCKNPKYLEAPVCDKCNVSPTPDDRTCCKEIIAGDKTNYKSFTSCCLVEENMVEENCKVDCTKDKENPLCCPEFLKDPKKNEKDFARCCALSEFSSRLECGCPTIMANPSNYPETTVCENCFKKLIKGEKASQEVEDLCNKCDCVADPTQECCKNKCTEVFLKPFSDLALFDECCKSTPSQP